MVAVTRRRGPALEEALLDAAWQELVEKGYAHFTIEGGADRARGGARPPRDRIGRPSGEAVGLEERRGDIRGGLLVDPHRLVHCGDRLHAQ